ncbi:flagellar motility protein MotE (MotC chaperone) [Lipingzhangella halophila]|uniref:Flagellar motility protein MotE (MotC chaperone) n=1 Tax=Lipingzhangella halophila TaxID=1783352 RepID=A0A7W7RLM1_9ACTN|nr:hypothetical protein [Lipingzhangella halophila]MBB4933803.1 flagellar motility protein MotE (MotC chaperone) [Lipingzhangella halophila]
MNELERPSRGRAYPRTSLLAGLAAATLLICAPAAYAEPEEEEVDIDELNERAEKLEEEYEGELPQYTDAKESVETAEEKLADVEDQLSDAEADVAQVAAAQYKGTGLDPTVEVVMSSSPDNTLDDAALAGRISDSNGERVINLTELKEAREEASEEAETELAEAKDLIDDLEEQRDDVLAKIEKYEEEQVPETPGDGTVPASAKGWGFDGATPRMAAIRDEIIQEFGAPFPVGCVRSSADDHGTGQACDFMMSNNGGHPSAENKELGQQIANYAQANADRLGVKYVIWEQRIWDSRNPGSGWKQMDDRGSITENHYDHVHVSSF